MSTTDLDHLERDLVAARDVLLAYWEQPEGQACFLGLRDAAETLRACHAADTRTMQERHPAAWKRIAALLDEVARLYAPLDDAFRVE